MGQVEDKQRVGSMADGKIMLVRAEWNWIGEWT